MAFGPAELGYAAGIIDGEGTISIKKHSQHGRLYYYARVTVGNTNLEMLEWMCERFGGTVSSNGQGNDKWKPLGVWALQDRRSVEAFLLDIGPYLVVKRQHCLTLLGALRSGLMESAYGELSLLNKRGSK